MVGSVEKPEDGIFPTSFLSWPGGWGTRCLKPSEGSEPNPSWSIGKPPATRQMDCKCQDQRRRSGFVKERRSQELVTQWGLAFEQK